MSQEPSQNQQILEGLKNMTSTLQQQIVTKKIGHAAADAVGLVILLTVITIVRFFIRRRRLGTK